MYMYIIMMYVYVHLMYVFVYRMNGDINDLSLCHEGGMYIGGWPPPCNPVYIKFYIIDSAYYWSLAESMGVVSGRGQPTLITVDLKVPVCIYLSFTILKLHFLLESNSIYIFN